MKIFWVIRFGVNESLLKTIFSFTLYNRAAVATTESSVGHILDRLMHFIDDLLLSQELLFSYSK